MNLFERTRDISIIDRNFGKNKGTKYGIYNEEQGRKSKPLKESRHD